MGVIMEPSVNPTTAAILLAIAMIVALGFALGMESLAQHRAVSVAQPSVSR